MKLTLIGPTYPYRGGIAHYTYYLDQALQASGIETQVISFKRQYPGWLYPGSSDKDPSQNILQTKADFVLDPLYPWTWLKAVQDIKTWNAEAVIFQWWTTFWGIPFAYISSKLKHYGMSISFIIHNVLPHEQKPYDKFLAKFALSKGDYFITQTIRQKEILLTMLPDACVKVCAFPIYPGLKETKITKLEARNKLSLPEQSKILLFFGIVRPYKGLEILLNAISALKNEGINAYTIIAGEFWGELDYYQSRINELGLTEHIYIDNRYIPNEEADLYFSAADFLIVPYVDGTQSAVVGLGFGYDIPMIVSEKAAEGIADDQKSFVTIVPTGDVLALSQAIRTSLTNPKNINPKTEFSFTGWECIIKALVGFKKQ